MYSCGWIEQKKRVDLLPGNAVNRSRIEKEVACFLAVRIRTYEQ
jgi:hypothetical protein